MASPICKILDPISFARTTLTDGYDTTTNTLITVILSDQTGVNSWNLICVGTDDQLDPDTVTASLAIDSVNKKATFTTTNNARGGAYLFQSVINGGLDINGRESSNYTTTFAIFAIGQSGVRLLSNNQTNEGSAQFGWIKDLNSIYYIWSNGISYATDYGTANITTTGDITSDTLGTYSDLNLLANGGIHLSSMFVETVVNGSYNDVTISDVSNTVIIFCGDDGHCVADNKRRLFLPSGVLGQLLIIINTNQYTLVEPGTANIAAGCGRCLMWSGDTHGWRNTTNSSSGTI
jgi:hypothetical protein